MAETTTAPKATPAPLPTGGAVAAIVPQTFEEIQRVANTVIAAGIAPQSLTKRVKDDATPEERSFAAQTNIAAVATAIMAGAELGLPPLVSLRSFTVINGRPALYADGNVAVVRKAKGADGKPICEYIRHGWEETDDEETTGAWCEAKRLDNGESHREFFSMADAKRAGLWDDRAEAEREVWEYVKAERKRMPVKKMMPNDAPWHRFPKRMMMWRAAGYCLRWLFADILGGMPDEYEARDIEGMIDITPQPRPEPPRPTPPAPPTDEDEDQTDPSEDSGDAPQETEESVDQTTGEVETAAGEAPTEGNPFDELKEALKGATTAKEVDDILKARTKDFPDKEDFYEALQMGAERVTSIERDQAEAAGQGSMFGDDEPFAGGA